MKRATMGAALVLVFFVAGCGRHAASIDGGGTPVQDSGTGAFKLRLAGVDKGNFVSARMRIQSVQVTSGGVVLANAPHTPEVDLAEMGQAYLLASCQPPAGSWRAGTPDPSRRGPPRACAARSPAPLRRW